MSDPEAFNTREGWKVLGAALREQKWGLTGGVAIGLAWTVGKVAVPQLTKLGIDRGIEGDGSLVLWSGLVVAAAR